MEAQKPNSAPTVKPGSNVRGIKNAFLVIIACFVVAVCLFLFVFGHPSHFDAEGFDGISMWFAGDEFAKAHPVDLIGTVFKGGIIVPILQTLFLTVIVLSVERAIALKSALRIRDKAQPEPAHAAVCASESRRQRSRVHPIRLFPAMPF